MDPDTDHSVTVTHFINPHLFWYRKINATDNIHSLALLEQKLQDLYKNKPLTETRCRPVVGDNVAVNFVVWNKFIRAKILDKAEFQQEEFIVWAIDYGFPLLTKKEHIRMLPESLAGTQVGKIHCGGVFNIQPAELEYDHIESNLVMIKQDQWLQKACDMLEKLLSDASSILFVEQFQSQDEHNWGDLIIVNHKGMKFNARKYLQTANYAMDVGDTIFPKICSSFKTTNIAPWLSNNRKSKFKFNSIKHNIAEHSQQMNSAIIDEFAKRKVEDWCERNARVEKGNYNLDLLESCAESYHDQSIDDITFDDSVSVKHHKTKMEQKTGKYFNDRRGDDVPHVYSEKCEQQINYIGKAGALTKLKQHKYGSKHSLPPQAHSMAFSMDLNDFDISVDEDLKTKSTSSFLCCPDPPTATGTVISSASSCTNVSTRIQRLAEMRAQHARSARKQPQRNICSSDLNTTTSSAASSCGGSVSSRMQKMTELRKKHARAEVEKHKPNESIISKESQSTTHPYQKLEQSIESIFDKTHETINDVSAKNARIKHLSQMRRRLQPPTKTTSDTDTISTIGITNTSESQLSISSSKYKENLRMINEEKSMDRVIDILETFDFKLQSKETTKEGKKATTEMLRLPLTPCTTANNKESQAAYEGLTLVPAGFDVTRLKTYRDEENHWHRKKSTRNEHVPHDTISSSEEFLINSSHDQSSSSTDFFQLKRPVVKTKHPSSSSQVKRLVRPQSSVMRQEEPLDVSSSEKDGTNNDILVQRNSDKSIRKPLKCSQQKSNSFHRDTAADVHYPNEISTSSTSTTTLSNQHNMNRKGRQLKSPTSQISKIDEILKQHSLEKERGNTNILDLKILSTSPQKSYNSDRRSNGTNASSDSFPDSQNIHTASNTNVLIENRNIGMLPPKSDKFLSEKHMKNISNYTTLMEVKHTDHLPIVEGEIKLQTKFIDHLVLAHCSIPLTPIENVAEASFLPEIHEEMQHMRINKVYRIQVYSWSHVLRGNSLFVVNPTKTGKTWSYLPALCSLVSCRFGRLKASYGPVAVVLVASSRHVEYTYGYCKRLMSGLKADAPSCVPLYGMRNFIDTKIQLLNGCGILVATPSSLLRLLKDNENEPLFDSERLQHIVIDDMDIMLSRSHEDFESAIRMVFKMSKKSKYKTLEPQLVVTSRDWDGVMIRLMRKSNQPLLLIGDFLEAAVYGRATLSVKLKSSQDKNDTIMRFIKKQSQSLQADSECKRILIMCNGDADVETVMQFLSECGYPCLPYYNRSTETERATVNEWKKKVSSQILICTDARFPELQIQNVQTLIHYSMPTSWTQFTTRFSALAQIYDNFVSNNFKETPAVVTCGTLCNESPAHSIILLDEDNSLQLPRLVDFMRKHNQFVHPDILAVSKRVLVMREELRICKGALLCPQLLEFGECDETRCDNRHELTRFDVIGEHDEIPCEGELRIHVLKVFSPTHYAARLLQHKSVNCTKWQEIRRSSETLPFTIKLDLHYRDQDNLSLHWPPHINDLCVYKYGDNFRRALILDAPMLTGKNTNVVQANLKVTLKLIDDGTVISAVKCSELFVCADQFKDFPAQAIDIRLMHIVPFDNERSWDSKTTKQVQKWIMDDIKPGHVVQVGITFSLANTVWVKNLMVMEMLSTLGTYRPFVNLKMSLIQKNFGMVYSGERKHVRDIAKEYGLLKAPSSAKIDDNNRANSSMEDFKSCQNDNSDLIKFSSSNGDVTNSSIESATDDLNIIHVVDDAKQKELNNVEDKERSDGKDKSIATSGSAEENWDELLCDDPSEGKKHGEVYIPLRTKSITDDKQSTPTILRNGEESWTQLLLNVTTKVEIGDEGENGNWENIFLQIIDKKHMTLFDDLVDLINKHVQNVKETTANKEQQQKQYIYDFEPLQNCIVKYNNMYLRAKVHGVFGTKVKERLYRFYLCDYACFASVTSHELYNDFFYDTTEEIINFIPYQSVHCTLAGIQWDRFTKRYELTRHYLYACAVEERTADEKKSLSLNNLPIRSYKILLFECEHDYDFVTAEMFNRTLVDRGIAKIDEATRHYLDYKLSLNDLQQSDTCEQKTTAGSEEDLNSSNSGSEIYTFERLLDLIQKSDDLDYFDNNLLEETKTDVLTEVKSKAENDITVEKLPQRESKKMYTEDDPKKPSAITSKIPAINSELDDEEEDHCTTDESTDNKKSSISITSSNDTSLVITPPPPVLKALYKRPMTTWYETDCLIFISIYAPDITDYFLEVSQTTVFFATQIQDDEYVVFLNLLGSVDPQTVSHEIKGLNVVVRLVKNVFVKWPRLLQESTKYSWLKYNYNAFDSIELEYIMPQQCLQSILETTPHIDQTHLYDDLDSDDSEQDMFQTFNPIADNDDNYDPFS